MVGGSRDVDAVHAAGPAERVRAMGAAEVERAHSGGLPVVALADGFCDDGGAVSRTCCFLLALLTAEVAHAARPGRPHLVATDLAQLVSPVPGEALVAGETAWLEWQAGPGLARHAAVEEWEAFVSFDGGETFPLRLTPHLDLDRSRIAFQVPLVASDDVRFLLRFGDEKVEWDQPVAGRFRIVPGVAARPVFRRRVPSAGEPARPGDRGVVLWAEGARDGSGWREVEARSPLAGLVPAFHAGPPLVLLAVPPERPRAGVLAGAARALGDAAVGGEDRRPPPPPLTVQPLLLLVHRLNR